MNVTTKLIHGDCLEVMPTLDAGSVQMCFADLPYGTLSCKWDTPICLPTWWRIALALGNKNTAYAFTSTQPFTTTLINSQPKLFKYDLVWIKNSGVGHLLAKKRPMRIHESVLIFSQKQTSYNPQMTSGHPVLPRTCRTQNDKSYGGKILQGRMDSTSLRFPVSALCIASDHQRRRGWKGIESSYLHPTQKPVALLEWLIKTYTNSGDTVLDPVFGSCTTGVACLRTGRNFIGIEKDPAYFAIGSRRIAEERARLGMESV